MKTVQLGNDVTTRCTFPSKAKRRTVAHLHVLQVCQLRLKLHVLCTQALGALARAVTRRRGAVKLELQVCNRLLQAFVLAPCTSQHVLLRLKHA